MLLNIEQNYNAIEKDMNTRNSTAKNKNPDKTIKLEKEKNYLCLHLEVLRKEKVEIIVNFD